MCFQNISERDQQDLLDFLVSLNHVNLSLTNMTNVIFKKEFFAYSDEERHYGRPW